MEDESNLDDVIQNDLDKKPLSRSKIANKGKEKARDAAYKTMKKARMTIFKPVGATVFSTVLSVFVIIFMLIGIISFITSMPGFVQEMIMNKVLDGLDKVYTVFEGSDYYLEKLARDTNKTAQKNVLAYLDDMGIDPVGFGFAPFYSRDSQTGEVSYDPQISADTELLEGNFFTAFKNAVKYNTALAEKVAKEDLVFKYIVSNERTYLVDEFDKAGNSLGLTGMIKTGIKGIDDSKITVDRENKTMTITSLNASEGFQLQGAKYNMDTYAGRYGTPLEFLLALHLATMSPDLTDEMVSNPNLKTELNLNLTKDNYKVDYEIRYNGKKLPIKGGSTGSYDDLRYLDDNIVKIDENGKAYVDLTDEQIEELKSKITVNSLQGWLDRVRNLNFDMYVGAKDISKITNEAKDALLGDGLFRVIYRVTNSEFGNDKAIDWSSYLGTVEDVNGKYTTDISETFDGTYSDIGGTSDRRVILSNQSGDGVGIEVITSKAIPNSNNLNQDNYVTGVMHGLDYYINGHENEMKNESISMALTCMLVQLDSYLYKENLSQFAGVQFTFCDIKSRSGDWVGSGDVQYNFGKLQSLRRDNGSLYSSMYILLAKNWMDFCSEHGGIENCSAEEIHQELVTIKELTQTYFDALSSKDKHLQEVMNDLLDKTGFEFEDDARLSLDDLKIIYDSLNGKSDEFEYVFPKITSVIKHWYKDIIFDAGDNNSVYKQTDKEIRQDVETENNKLQITAVMTAGNNYIQTGQPYVVKGDVVTLEGKVVENSSISDLEFKNEDKTTYRVGDGYRTTKKLFTEGQYYTFDGTEATSKSIWYAKELEKMTGQANNRFAKVFVNNGRIKLAYAFTSDEDAYQEFGNAYDPATGNWNTSAQVINESRNSSELPPAIQNGDGWSVFLAVASKKSESNEDVNIYYVKVTDSMNYLSVGDSKISLEDSKKSVEKINAFLSAMDVITQRKHISFDNTTASGDVITLTAFGLLEGMHTETSEYIYRDLKEFLVELGYYTKAEFDYLKTDVLQWFIPDYIPNENAETVAERKVWRQTKEEDALSYGAVLYPIEEENEDENNNEESNENAGTTKLKLKGFEEGLDVIAPGNARILALSESRIVLEFDGISQPEIGTLDKYTMIIDGIVIDPQSTVTISDDSQKTLQEIVDSGRAYSIKSGEKIGQTGTSKIKVILKNNIGGYVDNIENYMAPYLAPGFNTGVSGDSYEQISRLASEGFENIGVVGNDSNDAYSRTKQYYNIISKYSQQYGLDPYLIIALICQESQGVLNADNGSAAGLMQYEFTMNGPTHSYNGETITNITQARLDSDADLSIHVGCLMLKERMDKYHGNIPFVLQSYNFGQGGAIEIVKCAIAGYKGQDASVSTLLNAINTISYEQFDEYIKSGNLDWLKARVYYKNIEGGGDEKYVEHVLQYYNLNQD